MTPLEDHKNADQNVYWQLECHDLKQRGAALLRNRLWTDCEFVLGRERIHAHRLLLAMSSPILAAELLSSEIAMDTPITITDLTYEAFKGMIEYIYTDNVTISSVNFGVHLYYAAEKYMIKNLRKICAEYLCINVTPQTACFVYELGCLCQDQDLINNSLKVIETETLEVLCSDNFVEAEVETVFKIFSSDTLTINNDLDLFQAAERYAIAHNLSMPLPPAKLDDLPEEQQKDVSKELDSEDEVSQLQDVDTESENTADHHTAGKVTLRTVVEQIRFLTLTSEQFANGPAKSSLLPYKETLAILRNIIMADNADILMPSGFSTDKQCRYKAKATIQHVVSNVHAFAAPTYSHYVTIQGLLWRLQMQRDVYQSKHWLSVFLTCIPETQTPPPESWSCKAQVELKLLSPKPGVEPLARGSACVNLRQNCNSWCIPNFVSWEDMLNPAYGYLNCNSIKLEATIKVIAQDRGTHQ